MKNNKLVVAGVPVIASFGLTACFDTDANVASENLSKDARTMRDVQGQQACT